MLNMTTGPKGLALIKQYEGCELKAYRCPAGVLTIGYGYTGPDVKEGLTITRAEAERLLIERLRQEFEPGVSAEVTVPVSQEQFDALVCLAYNIGLEHLRYSTLLRKLNAGDYAGAAAEFEKWDKVDGMVLRGLNKRRVAERKLFEMTS